MTGINAFLYKILGASWFTSVVGYLVIIGGVAEIIRDAIATDGIPNSLAGWITFGTGIGIRASKQVNVSNSQKPMAVAQTVEAVPGATLAVAPPQVVKP